jgi:tetratricopeptide (TPR) repeat protein
MDPAYCRAAVAALALQNYELPQAKRSIERALEINPELIWARQLQADMHLANIDAAAAIETLNEAVKLNPRDERTLGRLAAAYVARDGPKMSGDTQDGTAQRPSSGSPSSWSAASCPPRRPGSRR